jgi:stage V sporulation protein SpoVS
MRELTALLCLACAAAAQAPRINDINYYGLHKVTAEKIQAVTGLRKGGTLTASKGDIEDQIDKIPGVVLVRVEALCCEGTAVDLFVGIEEKGAPHPAFHSTPEGTAALPREILDTYADFLSAVARAAARGNTTEDFTAGHSMMDDPEARAFQPRFLSFAADHFDWLRDVLRNSADSGQRAVAAALVGYGADRQQAAGELQYAIGDPDASVRNNAMRALAAIAVYAGKQPGSGIRIAPTWLVEMLHSIVLEDRIQAARALVLVTDSPNSGALDLIRERGIDSLKEMARWTTLRYALPPFLLLGRVAGMPDSEIHAQWETGDRESVIQKAVALEPGKHSHP